MARFMLTGTYTTEGIEATRTEGLTARTKAVKRAVESLGGKLLGMYWTTADKWPDCADAVPYDFRAECARVRDVAVGSFGF